MTTYMLKNIEVKSELLKDEKYKYITSVESVNKLVLEGVAFRDAYKQVGLEIESGNYWFDDELNHSHLGSIGNLGSEQILQQFEKVFGEFGFAKIIEAENQLLK